MSSNNEHPKQAPRLGGLLGYTGRRPGYLPRLSVVLRYTPHLGFRTIARVTGEHLAHADMLRSHLKLSHGVYAETTLTLDQLTEMHECEHQDPSYPWTNRIADHDHEPRVDPVTIKDGFSW
jgi:hypothetical protein